MVHNLEYNYLNKAKYRLLRDFQQREFDSSDQNQQQRSLIIMLQEVISQPCDVSEMMEGQEDEKADVAVKSSRIFLSKKNVCHVDKKKSLNVL